MKLFASMRRSSKAEDGATSDSGGYPGGTAVAKESAPGSEHDQEMLMAFLLKYGYAAADASSWQTSSSSESPPLLSIHVSGHDERDGHTWYQVECSLASSKHRPMNWQVSRRLAQLREDLHDPVKTSLGKSYDTHFGKAPFAHMGGPRGTTA